MTESRMETEPDKELILASASPRRQSLLRQSGYCFRVKPATLSEPEIRGSRVSPPQHAEAVSYFKARSAMDDLERGVVLAADTVVAYGGAVFGKPAHAGDARRILSTLCGTRHEVITGVAVLDVSTGRREIRHDVTKVTMRPMPDDVLEAYIASGAWEGKAGAYGIQDHGGAFIERIDGSFTNVVGLPMEMLAEILSDFGIEPGEKNAENGVQCPSGA